MKRLWNLLPIGYQIAAVAVLLGLSWILAFGGTWLLLALSAVLVAAAVAYGKHLWDRWRQ